MAVTQTTTQPDDHEETTKRQMLAIVREIADSLAHDTTQLSAAQDHRDDMLGFEVDNPVTPGIVFTKRGVTDDGWGYEWNRIHVTVAASSIGTSTIMKIKDKHDLKVVDVWQMVSDMDKEMGNHDEPGIQFALEPRE